MSSQSNQSDIWTPPVVATIVYRVVMIIVSIAFIWKKYQEQLISVLLPTYNSTHLPRPPNQTTQSSRRKRTHSQPRRLRTPSLREIILANVEDIIQSALGIDDGDSITIDVPRLSFDDSSERSSRRSAEVGEIGGDVGFDVDVDLGDVGLRHRSADCISGSHSSRHEVSSKEG
ncbi:hypothetical protein L207DRAFT_642249 [Hyaloscypha variabilis F]|uniref:Uncharacterized protein n=1 Tax=Hyaloscypha variabilis (strain UAMH 11265 / GT02V1 / F) TaxID=1149755 RepID=A0A2J6QTW8_HYAVF|nr:hypothetical protein L207DRAFT_642249 [Hyaloscypha variabilis F]